MKERLFIVDALRGVASLAVCWFHLTNGYPKDSFVWKSGHYGWLGVEIFFVISGFIIPFALYRSGYKIKQHWHIFIQKRIIRIDPPYIFAAGMAALIWYMSALAPGFKGSTPDFSTMQILLHFGYLNGIFGYPWLNVVFWTLAIEFQFYLLISILFPIVISSDVKLRTSGIILLCLAAFVLPSNVFVFKYLCLFSVGIVTFQYFAKIVNIREYLFVIGLTSVFLFLSLGVEIALIGIVTALVIAFIEIKRYAILSFLGAISYSLYLVHAPIGGRVVNLGKRFATTEIEYFIISFCGVVLSIFVAYLLYRFIEKPAQEWSSRISYRLNIIKSPAPKQDAADGNIQQKNT